MTVDDGCEDTGPVAVRFDLVQLAGLDERREHGPFLCAGVMNGKERVLSLQGGSCVPRRCCPSRCNRR